MRTVAGVRTQLTELVDLSATVYDVVGVDCGYWHFGQTLVPLFGDEKATHRDAVFSEGGRLRGEVQANEHESNSSNSGLGLYSPRNRLQLAQGEPFYHSRATMCRDSKYVHRLYELDELYDLENDPGETQNLVRESSYSSELDRLKARMLEWYMTTSDVVPLESGQRNFARTQ